MYAATDTEATGLVWAGTEEDWGFFPARPFAFSFYFDSGESLYYRWEVDPFTRRVIPGPKSERREIQEILGDPDITKVFHNRTYDQRMYELSGFTLRGRLEDTLASMHAATGGDELTFGLKPLADKYLDIGTDDESALRKAVNAGRKIGKKKGWCLAQAPFFGRDAWKADMWLDYRNVPELCETYCVRDAERTLLLWHLSLEELENNEGMMRTYQREMQLMPYIYRMEMRGVRCFPENIEAQRKHYDKLKEKYYAKIVEEVGHEINLRSPKQVREYFFTEKGLNLEPVKMTKGGKKQGPQPAADGEVMNTLALEGVEVAKWIIDYRSAANAISLYLDPYDRLRYQAEDGNWYLHTNIKQVGPITGRMAATDPNMMNVASESTGLTYGNVKMKPRSCFGPREGCIWYLPDYKQIEVWVFGFLSNDETWMEALLSGEDFHGRIAREVFSSKEDYEENKLYYRKRSKMIQFCKFYGGGAGAVARNLREPINVARKFIKDYDRRMPGVQKFMDETVREAEAQGYVVNLMGRHLRMPTHLAYRGTNYKIQSLASDVFKTGIIRCQDMLDERWPGSEILIPLHDELVIEVPLKYHSKRLMRDIAKAMASPYKDLGFPVPFPIEMKVAPTRWNLAKELGVIT